MSKTYEQLEPVISALDNRISAKAEQIDALDTRVIAVEDAIADKADSDKIGDLSQLETTAKDNLVSATNEVEADVEQLKADLDDNVNDLKSTISTGYAVCPVTTNGSFGSSGLATGATNRIRTDLIPFVKGDVITIENGTLQHACGMWEGSVSSENIHRNDNAFILTDETIMPSFNGYLVVVFRNSSNSALSPSAFDGSIKKYPELMGEITNILPYFKTPQISFVAGYYYNTTNQKIQAESGYSYVKLDVSLFRGGKISGVTSVTPNSSYGIAFVDSDDVFLAGYTSSNTGSYVFGYDLLVPDTASYMYISCRNAEKTSTWVDPSYSWDVVIDNIIKMSTDTANIGNGFVNAKLLNSRHVHTGDNAPLTLLHFSDLHGDKSALARIMDYAKTYGENIDDIICTGDIVKNTYGEIASWWEEDVMTCIGNHDTATSSGGVYNWTALSMADRDAYYIAPFESNWGIVHTSGTSYYYKDYATQNIRLIVMDVMLYTGIPGGEATAQTAWLENLLADAIANSLHVLIAIHAPHGGAVAEDCSFSRYGQTAMPTYSDCNTPQTVIDAVAAKISAGLHFIGYLVGHTHQDNIWDAENDNKQLMYCVTCAATAQSSQWQSADLYRGIGFDAFNLITIDTTNNLIKIVRGGGANMDDHMRTRKAICIDYSTGNVVGEAL